LSEEAARRILKEQMTSFIALERVAGLVYNIKFKKVLAKKEKLIGASAVSFQRKHHHIQDNGGPLGVPQQLPHDPVEHKKAPLKRFRSEKPKTPLRRRRTIEPGEDEELEELEME